MEAGWLLPTVTFLLVWGMTALSTAMLCEAMRRIPGNDNFTDRIEYTSVIRCGAHARARMPALTHARMDGCSDTTWDGGRTLPPKSR